MIPVGIVETPRAVVDITNRPHLIHNAAVVDDAQRAPPVGIFINTKDISYFMSFNATSSFGNSDIPRSIFDVRRDNRRNRA